MWKVMYILAGLLLVGGCALELGHVEVSCAEPERDAVKERLFGKVGIQECDLTVDGEPFRVIGMGYEPGCRPGRRPWDRPWEPDLLRLDFERIRAAGFNTIRTWTPLMDAEFELAAEYGLWVIPGVWFDPQADFNDPAFRRSTLEMVRREIARMSKHENVLYYLLLNEPHADAVYRAGLDQMEAFYEELIACARGADPKRLFSYSNCVITDFMDAEKWDIVSMNVYPYSPCQIDQCFGYDNYLRLMRERMAPNKPFVVTEFGLSVSPSGDGRGYGGNSLREQADGVLRMWDSILRSGAAGGCVFMWVDGWWKAGNESVHDDHAEEWYGLLSADEDERGIPRPVYYALAEYNRTALKNVAAQSAARQEGLEWVIAPPHRVAPGGEIRVRVRVTDENGRPASGRRVDVARFVHTKWNEWHALLTTDEQGLAEAGIPNPEEKGILSVAVAVRQADGTPVSACLYETVMMEEEGAAP
ncbi:MAG: glycoside hydrolase family 2 TIM barrel-domain containing protein [Kiritimatiellae bacterium]|nr:glycoside hydrolase family 2 TIM barrel-domain containing protein [Kiritimatiellia bacterium]